jgi:hypothetical protein
VGSSEAIDNSKVGLFHDSLGYLPQEKNITGID